MTMFTKTENNIAKSPLVREALKFWFADNEHIRSPFPGYIQVAVQKAAVNRFSKWVEHLNDIAKDDVNEEILAEKFEENLFECGLELVETEDEKITLLYPFLPRIGDPVSRSSEEVAHLPSTVSNRKLSVEGDSKYLNLEMVETESGKRWETQIELPA